MVASVQHARVLKAGKLEAGLGVVGIQILETSQITSVTVNFYCGTISCVLITLWNKQKLKYCKGGDGHNHINEQVSSKRAKQPELPPPTPPAELFPTTLPGKGCTRALRIGITSLWACHQLRATTATAQQPLSHIHADFWVTEPQHRERESSPSNGKQTNAHWKKWWKY